MNEFPSAVLPRFDYLELLQIVSRITSSFPIASLRLRELVCEPAKVQDSKLGCRVPT
jgi:hypothetical protein